MGKGVESPNPLAPALLYIQVKSTDICARAFTCMNMLSALIRMLLHQPPEFVRQEDTSQFGIIVI